LVEQIVREVAGMMLSPADDPTTTLVPQKERGYIPILDGLRAVSIALVLGDHLVSYHPDTAWLQPVGKACGSTGVSLFLVISGYLITRLLLLEEHRRGRIHLRLFYARRALRIFPAFYAYMVVVLLLTGAGVLDREPLYSYVASLLYLRNLAGRGWETGHLWSLSLEEQFYLLWPTVLVLTPARHRLPVVGLLIAAVLGWRSVLVLSGHIHEPALGTRTDVRIDAILVGCLLALLAQRGWLARLRPGTVWPVLLASLLLVANAVVAHHAPLWKGASGTFQAVFLAVILYGFLEGGPTVLHRVLETPPVLFLGKLSYGIYLWQQLVLGPPTGFLGALRASFPANLIVALGLALVSYFVMEKPFLALKDRYFKA
jgi:peptidoglycan/LPS O-acetylase OafA/YrhL